MTRTRTKRGSLLAVALSSASVLSLSACVDDGEDEGDEAADEVGTDESETDTDTTSDTETDTGEDPGCEFQGIDPELGPPEFLSEMCLMDWDGQDFLYEDNVYRYELNTPLFSDFALKERAIYVPPGETVEYRDNEVFEFPVGTVILKSFYFPADLREPELDRDLIETRVLVRFPEEWKTYPYVWDHDLGDAVYTVQGEIRPVEFIGPDGIERTASYLIPQKNQCLKCHEIKDEADETVVTPIGPRARHLNRDQDFGAGPVNQLSHYAEQGWLTGVPALDQVPSAWDMRELADKPVAEMSHEEVTVAARDYLDINCAYCHNPRGVNGISSQLFLNWDNEDTFHLGYCKKPGSAGKGGEDREYDIVPGDAEASILVYRTETLELGAMMPEFGRSLVHEDGILLLRAWIDGLPPDDCEAEGEPDPEPDPEPPPP